MATVPDLYQCLSNYLDKYIFDYLQPNEEFLSQVRAAVNTICDFLKENCYRGHPSKTKVLKVVKGGSSAKGTALKTGSDADLVVFLTSIQSYSQQETKRKEIIEEMKEKLEQCQSEKKFEVIIEQTKWDNPRVLSFRLRSRRVTDFIDFDVLPAYDALGQLTAGYRPDPKVYVDLIKNWSPAQNFSTCFTELQRDFIIARPAKVKCLIRLVKHWYNTKLKGKKLPPKYALELVSIYAWEKGSEGRERFNMAQAFRNFLELICNYEDLCIYWTVNYNPSDSKELESFLRKQLDKPRPVILDPADPTGNFGEGYNWEQVAREAERCLSQMCNKTAPGLILGTLRDLPAMLLNVKLLTGATYAIEVDPSLPISAIKDQVANKTGVPAYQQKLALQNGEYVELKNTVRLSEYNLSPGATVMLMVKEDTSFQVFLMTDKGRNSTYIITPSEGVTEFKGRIQQKERVQVSQFWLSYESRPLEDGRKLGEYNIVPEGTIYMNLRLRGG